MKRSEWHQREQVALNVFLSVTEDGCRFGRQFNRKRETQEAEKLDYVL